MTDTEKREKVILELEKEVSKALIPDKPKGYMFTVDLIENALELLKAQEPRVMTLEEVQRIGKKNIEFGTAPYETCIYEKIGCKRMIVCAPLGDEPQFEGDDIQYLFIGTDEYDIIPVNEYGRKIRCWHGFPTEEQRKAAKWG